MKTKQPTNDLTKFQFRGDHVLIQAIRPDAVSTNGLIKPEQYDDKPEFGKVISVGELVGDLKVGDTIFFGKYSTEQTRSLGEDYYIIRQEDVKAVNLHDRPTK